MAGSYHSEHIRFIERFRTSNMAGPVAAGLVNAVLEPMHVIMERAERLPNRTEAA